MTTDLERVARARWDAWRKETDVAGVKNDIGEWCDQPEVVRKALMRVEAAALHALMEPSEGMLEAASKRHPIHGGTWAQGVTADWQAMLRHILEEGG